MGNKQTKKNNVKNTNKEDVEVVEVEMTSEEFSELMDFFDADNTDYSGLIKSKGLSVVRRHNMDDVDFLLNAVLKLNSACVSDDVILQFLKNVKNTTEYSKTVSRRSVN